MRRLLPIALAAALAGCTLIDQNTFNPHAGDAPVVPKPAVPQPPPPGPPPLLVIGPAATGYADVLGRAVDSARARKPDVVFDVVEIRRKDAVADDSLGANAAAVAEAIVARGVAPDRVRLVARPEAAGAPGEVRVFVH